MIVRNKKGFIGDIPFIIAILFLFAIVIIVMNQFFTSFNAGYQTSGASNNSKELVDTNQNRYSSLFDGIFMFVFAILAVLLFVSVATIGTRPEFFFITMILIAIFVGVGGLLSNTFTSISSNHLLNSSTNDFTFIPFIMDKLPFVILFFGIVVVFGLYVKIKGFV
jgi:ABC-type cobalt transport system substrate-binding protein